MQTLKANNGVNANFGNVTIQPISQLLVDSDVKSSKDVGAAILNLTVLSAPNVKEKPEKDSIITNVDLTSRYNVSLSSIVKSAISSMTIIPLLNRSDDSSVNSSVGCHNVSVSKFATVASLINDLSTKNALSTNRIELYDTKFSSYEKDTGISQERPEILMLTNFLPLFKDNIGSTSFNFDDVSLLNSVTNIEGIRSLGLTAAGYFINAQFNSRILTKKSIEASLTSVDKKAASKIRTKLYQDIRDLKIIVASVLQKVVFASTIGEKLNMRDTKTDAGSIVDNKLGAFMGLTMMSTFDQNIINVESMFDVNRGGLLKLITNDATLSDILQELGFKQNIVKNVFSTTKVWLQSLYELKVLFQTHSDKFVNSIDSKKASDTDPININKSSVSSNSKFGSRHVSVVVPTVSTLQQREFIQNKSQLDSLVNDFLNSYDILTKNVDFSDIECKICLLTNNINQEFKYSYFLSSQQVKTTLSKNYGYTVNEVGTQTDNFGVFDSIVGIIPNNVLDFVTNNRANLAYISQQVVGNVAVLPFEKRYIELNSSTVTSGKSFYIDDVFRVSGDKFNTSNVKSYTNSLLTSMNNFVNIALRMNLFSFSLSKTSKNSGMFNPFFDSKEILNYIITELTDQGYSNADVIKFTKQTSSVIDVDPSVSIFSHAARNKKVLVLLYLLCVSWGSIKETLVNDLIDELVRDFSSQAVSINESEAATVLNMNVLQFKQFLRSGTFFQKIRLLLQTIMKQLTQQSSPTVNMFVAERSYYSGNYDSMILLSIFDLICTLIDAYANMHIMRITSTDAYDTNYTFIMYKKFDTSFNDRSVLSVHSKLDQERSRIQQLSLSLLSNIDILNNMLTKFTSDLESSYMLSNLKKMSGYIDNKELLKIIFDEQQLSTVLNVLTDMSEKLSNVDINSDNVYENIDDVTGDSKLKSILFSVLNRSEFAISKGFNKKVFTVGIPLGFTKKFKYEKIASTKKASQFTDRIYDTVKITLYKVDLEYSDIVFKPQTFLFELSRYPVRNSSMFITTNETITYDNMINFVPTRNINSVLNEKSNDKKIEYYDTNKLPDSLKNFALKAFSGEDYSFLTETEKQQLLRNHVTSFLLEGYVKLMTGIDVSEHTFQFDPYENTIDNTQLETMINDQIFNMNSQFLAVARNLTMTNNSSLSIFPASMNLSAGAAAATNSGAETTQLTQNSSNGRGLPGTGDRVKQTTALDDTISNVTAKGMCTAVEIARSLTSASRTISTLSNSDLALKRVVQPKQFDRVFSMIVDPDDFVVNVNDTLNTTYGKQTLELLVSQGKLLSNDLQSRESASGFSNTETYKIKEKIAGELSFERYFVSIESFE